MTTQEKTIIIEKLRAINNVAKIMDTLFKPFDEFKKQKNYTNEEAIKAKESAQQYLYKYGTFTLEKSIEGIRNLIEK